MAPRTDQWLQDRKQVLKDTLLVAWKKVSARLPREREFFIDNLLVRIHFIIVIITWTDLAQLEFRTPHFPGRVIFFNPVSQVCSSSVLGAIPHTCDVA